MHGPHPRRQVAACSLLLALASAAVPGCTRPNLDPVTALTSSPYPEEQAVALQQLSAKQQLTEEERKAVRRILFAPGYGLASRQAAFELLMTVDRKGMQEALETNIARMDSFDFRRWVLEQVGARGMKDYTTVIVNSWAGPVPIWGLDDRKRPEFEAMAALYGPDKVGDALFAVMNDASPVRQAALRARTWELLMRIGERERLKQLVTASAIRPDDAMLRDIKQLVADLGILPETREELIWLGKLRQTASPAYWKMAGEALRAVPEDAKRRFELRGIPVAIAAHRYAPELLTKDRETLYADLVAQLKTRDAGKYSANFVGWDTGAKRTEQLAAQHDEVTWLDLVACTMAIRMVDDPAIRARIFDIGDRDQQDRRTEYGGVVRIDDAGTWQVVEVRPRTTGSDTRFEAPQELFDQGYTSLFHFHLHAQDYENGGYAGPHMGDFGYAQSTRANCLVFSFVNRSTMDVDFYRHGPVVVDLGTIKRP